MTSACVQELGDEEAGNLPGEKVNPRKRGSNPTWPDAHFHHPSIHVGNFVHPDRAVLTPWPRRKGFPTYLWLHTYLTISDQSKLLLSHEAHNLTTNFIKTNPKHSNFPSWSPGQSLSNYRWNHSLSLLHQSSILKSSYYLHKETVYKWIKNQWITENSTEALDYNFILSNVAIKKQASTRNLSWLQSFILFFNNKNFTKGNCVSEMVTLQKMHKITL